MFDFPAPATINEAVTAPNGAVFTWDGMKWTTSANAAAVAAAITASTVNVLDHGAAGDGTTDDTAAIQGVLNAYAGKATVFLPYTGSNYRTKMLTIPSGTDLLLMGVLLALPALTSNYVLIESANSIIIRGNGVINPNGPAQTSLGVGGLYIDHSSNIRVSGITIQPAFGTNLTATYSNDVVIDGVTLIGGGVANGFATECDDCWLVNSMIDGTGLGDYAMSFYGGVTNSGAIGNVVKNAGASTTGAPPGIGILSDGPSSGPQGQPCHNIMIANNIVHDCNAGGISSLQEATGSPVSHTGVIISNNRCYGNNKLSTAAAGDITIDQTRDVTITGNQISANGASGLTVAGIYLGVGAIHVSIVGNQIYNIGQGATNGAGIWTNAAYVNISSNYIYDSQTTHTMLYSIIGGSGVHVSVIGNFLDLPTNFGTGPDTVFANAVGGVWTVGSPGGADYTMAIDAAAAHHAMLQYQTQGLPRWQVGTDGVAETGSNTGSNYSIWSYSDSGTQLENLSINRATGQVGLAFAPTFTNLPTNAANDAAAATAGVPVGGVYRSGSQLMVRVA